MIVVIRHKARPDADDTLICLFSDHGDHLGDHHAWQKESFFDASAHIPFLVSSPARLSRDRRRNELVCVTDLFGIATTAAGKPEIREGRDLLGMVTGAVAPRVVLVGYYGLPGTDAFKMMVRGARWKYLFFANGGHELRNLAAGQRQTAAALRAEALAACRQPGASAALTGGGFKVLPFRKWQWRGERTFQFDRSRGVAGFPRNPGMS